MSIKPLIACTVAAALIVAAPSGAQQPIVIKFSHVAAPDTPKGQAANEFKRLAEERTQGKVKVEVYPNSILFKDAEELDALKLGTVQMLAPVPGKFGPAGIPEFEVFDLPYLFPDHRTPSHRAYKSKAGADALKKLEPHGMVGLAFWDNGFRVMSANKPIHVPADMKGLKMRINSSKVNAAIMKSVGAVPQTIAFSEVYQGLQTGVIDGTEGPLSNLYTQKQFEVQKHVSLTYHTISNYVVVANKTFWDGLSRRHPHDARRRADAMRLRSTTRSPRRTRQTAIAGIKARARARSTRRRPRRSRAWIKRVAPVQDEMASRVKQDDDHHDAAGGWRAPRK